MKPGMFLRCHNRKTRLAHANIIITSFNEILGFMEKQYDDILAMESRIKRNPRFRDNRVHVMLYFITPTGHG